SGLICKSASYSGNFKLVNMILSGRNDYKQHQNKSLGLKDFKELNYRVFHERRKVIDKQKEQCPNYQKELHEFINNKSPFIFQTEKMEHNLGETQLLENEIFLEDRYNNIPPLEYCMKVNPELRARTFYEDIKCGDILYTEVAGYAAADDQSNTLISFYQLKVLAILVGKHKYLKNTNIYVYMDLQATQPSPNKCVIYKGFDMNDISREIWCWKVGTQLIVKVMSVDRENGIICVGTNNLDNNKNVNFGDINKQFPHIFSAIENMTDKDLNFTEFLEKSAVFNSKLQSKKLYNHYFPKKYSSLMNSLSGINKDNVLEIPVLKSFRDMIVDTVSSPSVYIRSINTALIQQEQTPNIQ
ncbi:unnamed protein product, partial [Meganyctiphanes norvegica]